MLVPPDVCVAVEVTPGCVASNVTPGCVASKVTPDLVEGALAPDVCVLLVLGATAVCLYFHAICD